MQFKNKKNVYNFIRYNISQNLLEHFKIIQCFTDIVNRLPRKNSIHDFLSTKVSLSGTKYHNYNKHLFSKIYLDPNKISIQKC